MTGQWGLVPNPSRSPLYSVPTSKKSLCAGPQSLSNKRFQMTFETVKTDVVTSKLVLERVPQLRSDDTETPISSLRGTEHVLVVAEHS